MIYLDHAATTPLPEAVADTMYDVLRHQFGNPSAQYPLGREAKELVEEARRTIAGALGCQPSALHFTSCGTESDNWAIRAAAWQGRHTGRHIITTAVEHSAVLEPCRQLEQEGYEVTYLKPDRTGHISAGQVAEALREDTVLVSVMLVNNETGCLFPVADIARLLKERGSRALLHCDAVQGFLKVPCAPAGSVRPSGPAEPAAPAGRRRAGGGAALRHGGHGPDSGLCQGRGAAAGGAGGKACPHGPHQGLLPGAAAEHPRRGAGGRRRGPPHSGRWWAIPVPTSSTIWAVRASACPQAPPVTGARPAVAMPPLGWIKGPPPGCCGSASGRKPRRVTSTPCTRRCCATKIRDFPCCEGYHAAMSET